MKKTDGCSSLSKYKEYCEFTNGLVVPRCSLEWIESMDTAANRRRAFGWNGNQTKMKANYFDLLMTLLTILKAIATCAAMMPSTLRCCPRISNCCDVDITVWIFKKRSIAVLIDISEGQCHEVQTTRTVHIPPQHFRSKMSISPIVKTDAPNTKRTCKFRSRCVPFNKVWLSDKITFDLRLLRLLSFMWI